MVIQPISDKRHWNRQRQQCAQLRAEIHASIVLVKNLRVGIGLRNLHNSSRNGPSPPILPAGFAANGCVKFKIAVAGEMAEWLKAHAWKACLGETLTWVRIPLSPP